MKADLICIDMFQTLVDINPRKPFIWKRILGGLYSDELATECDMLVSNLGINGFHERCCSSAAFEKLSLIFRPYFQEISRRLELNFDAEWAVEVFLQEHGNAEFYEDTLEFFRLLENKIPICLVSDADKPMVEPIIEKLRFDQVFISECVGAYKNGSRSRMFNRILEEYRIQPERIIHIGDSSSDILGAARAGIKSCWINRMGKSWDYNGKPDYVIRSLLDIKNIICF